MEAPETSLLTKMTESQQQQVATPLFFVERLSLWAWCWGVLPRLWQHRRTRSRHRPRCYVFEGSSAATHFASLFRWCTGVTVEPLDFTYQDARDERGCALWVRIVYEDLARVQAEVQTTQAFRAVAPSPPRGHRVRAYVAKTLVSGRWFGPGTLMRTLLMIRVCAWELRRRQAVDQTPVLFLEHRPGFEAVRRYAADHGVEVMAMPARGDIKAWLLRHLTAEQLGVLGSIRMRWLLARRRVASVLLRRLPSPVVNPGAGPRLAVDYAIGLHLDHPEYQSSLFFWQQSSLSTRDLVVLFKSPRDPLDAKQWADLVAHDLKALVLDPGAARVSSAPVFLPHPHRDHHRQTDRLANDVSGTAEAGWVKQQARRYQVLRTYWLDLLARERIKVYVSWDKYDAGHDAIADALETLGGVSAIYQRSYYDCYPTVLMATAADIVFGFSQTGAEAERRSGSTCRYYVTTGYLGDHRAALWRQPAQELRASLRRRGAERIIAFLDEKTVDDAKWDVGHAWARRDYAFLLERVLAQPWVGLILKPKAPRSLRRRLGPVADVLQRAEATGRCVVIEGEGLQSPYPPVAAALAADLAIHSHLSSGTAGFETALAGVPTLLMDPDGWQDSPLYALGPGRVIFAQWPELWTACLEQWKGCGRPGFGDWSGLIRECDPFRDGRAAERMGTYVAWLLEGFRAGRDRDTVMADAAQRYRTCWGPNAVTELAATETAWALSQPAMDTVPAG